MIITILFLVSICLNAIFGACMFMFKDEYHIVEFDRHQLRLHNEELKDTVEAYRRNLSNFNSSKLSVNIPTNNHLN